MRWSFALILVLLAVIATSASYFFVLALQAQIERLVP